MPSSSKKVQRRISDRDFGDVCETKSNEEMSNLHERMKSQNGENPSNTMGDVAKLEIYQEICNQECCSEAQESTEASDKASVYQQADQSALTEVNTNAPRLLQNCGDVIKIELNQATNQTVAALENSILHKVDHLEADEVQIDSDAFPTAIKNMVKKLDDSPKETFNDLLMKAPTLETKSTSKMSLEPTACAEKLEKPALLKLRCCEVIDSRVLAVDLNQYYSGKEEVQYWSSSDENTSVDEVDSSQDVINVIDEIPVVPICKKQRIDSDDLASVDHKKAHCPVSIKQGHEIIDLSSSISFGDSIRPPESTIGHEASNSQSSETSRKRKAIDGYVPC